MGKAVVDLNEKPGNCWHTLIRRWFTEEVETKYFFQNTEQSVVHVFAVASFTMAECYKKSNFCMLSKHHGANEMKWESICNMRASLMLASDVGWVKTEYRKGHEKDKET